ncbi:MAG: Hsp20/alpha crystallin family protein [bacterium]|nr:Hsp20/alpha crystallin family protein [bacterium]
MTIPEKSRPHPLVELYGEFPDRLRGDRWQPSADVFETSTEVVVRFEVAGVRGEDLRVNVEGTVLRLRGVRRTPHSGAIDRLQQMEISFGPFEREIAIQTSFDADAVRARLEDGFLEVRIPKRSADKRTLEVEAE